MKLRLPFAFFLVYAVVYDIPLLRVPKPTESAILQQEHGILSQERNSASGNLEFNSSTGTLNSNVQTEQQQHVSPAHPHDKRETSQSSSLSSDITLHSEILTQNSSEMVTEQTESPVFTAPKLMCASTHSENMTQNTTEFSSNTTASVPLVNSTLDCTHFGRSMQTTARTFSGVGKSEAKPSKNTKSSSQNSVGVWTSSCSADPSQRLCGCTSICIQLNNCCYDSEYVDFDQESISNKTQYSCYENFGAKWILPSPSRLIDKCLPEWTDDSVRQRCESPNPSDFESYLPCDSPETDLVYKNVYCLRCNGLVNFSVWDMTFLSDFPLWLSDINTFEKANTIAGMGKLNRHNYFSVSPPANQEPLHCLSSAVRKCNDKFNNNATLSKLCQAYYDPVILGGVSYRNIDCLRCSSNHSAENIVRFSKRSTNWEFKVLLRFAYPLSGQVKKCLGDTCSPTVSRIRGYWEIYPLSVTTINRDGAAVNASTTKDILTFWQVALRNKTRSELVGFNARIAFPTHINNYTMTVAIYDEIRIHQVPQFQKTIRSLSLHVNYSDTISVSCHVTQFRSEPTPTGGDAMTTMSEGSFVNSVKAAESSVATVAVFLVGLVVTWVLFH